MEALLRADPGPDPRVVVGPNRGADLARGAGLGTRKERSISRLSGSPSPQPTEVFMVVEAGPSGNPAKRKAVSSSVENVQAKAKSEIKETLNSIRLEIQRLNERLSVMDQRLTVMDRKIDAQNVLQGSDADYLWLEEVHIDGAVVRRWLRHMMTGSEPTATMDDVYVLFGALLCNVNSKEGTNINQEWFQYRVNDLVALFPAVSEPPPVPLYSEAQAAALSAFEEQCPFTAAHIVCTIVEGRCLRPLQRLQEYVCEQWRITEMIQAQKQKVGECELEVVQQAQESAKSGPPAEQRRQEVDASMVPVESRIPVTRGVPETAKCDNAAVSQPLDVAVSGPPVVQQPCEAAIQESPAVQEAQRVSIFEPPLVHLVQEVATSESPLVPQPVDFARSKPPADSQPRKIYRFMTTTVPRLMVYAFPRRMGDFDPNWIRLLIRGGNLDTTVACLLGFIKFFCKADYYKLRNTMSGSGCAATMDDVYVLFGVLLCNVNADGTDFHQEWFQKQVNDLVALFLAVSEPPPIPLYSESQADALAAFGQQWPYTAAHIVCTIVERLFKGFEQPTTSSRPLLSQRCYQAPPTPYPNTSGHTIIFRPVGKKTHFLAVSRDNIASFLSGFPATRRVRVNYRRNLVAVDTHQASDPTSLLQVAVICDVKANALPSLSRAPRSPRKFSCINKGASFVLASPGLSNAPDAAATDTPRPPARLTSAVFAAVPATPQNPLQRKAAVILASSDGSVTRRQALERAGNVVRNKQGTSVVTKGRSFRDALTGGCASTTTEPTPSTTSAPAPQADPKDVVLAALAAAIRAVLPFVPDDSPVRALCAAALAAHDVIAPTG
ncbi:hypothetical protein HPB52_019036 [Rhipicephalus sanguineus]|uniref:Uncharacterized protein n=1 Tax=Rhipicephalus sanguineus TaxID=34632 RepID=A0A9D4QEE8_RHISA|nr:hypothetical protein HPB52_019036 [Rhipicephalus sanguineus]